MTEPVWKTYTTRNFSTLSYMACQRSDQYDEAVIIIHGITAELSEQKKFASVCRRPANVFLPVLRGYDQMNSRGDVDYVGQYDHDLFDFIHYIKKQGYQRITLMGHSMGCANLLRLIKQNPDIGDAYVFTAPFFHPALPVYKNEASDPSGGGNDVEYTVYTKKVMILMTLYKMNIHRFEKAAAAEIPDEFDSSGRLHLSFRLLISRFPEKVTAALLKDVQAPVTIAVGDRDEVIEPQDLKNWCRDTWGRPVDIIKGADHNDILYDPAFHEIIDEMDKPANEKTIQ
ncbi:alpha/beta hydrolase [Halobacillus litoralis]|uniref:alpha/beta hydrolase n=1 Tax=Halobacillus litoralis TaxID=45668 RepID=UPI00136CE514|nr:alpha/beta hydrolase [Halobacillus litoralis]MYL38081.1 alpha/beta fold hydrolase [Halobacillus litoralis]